MLAPLMDWHPLRRRAILQSTQLAKQFAFLEKQFTFLEKQFTFLEKQFTFL